MKSLQLALTSLKRDWRSGELALIAIAVVIAVTSLTSVGFFTDRVRKATEQQATELLAADLVLRSREPIPSPIREAALEQGLTATQTLSFRSIVVHGDNMQMAEAKAVEQGYPQRGNLRTADELFGPESITEHIPAPGQAWADARLLQSLDLRVGDRVDIGAAGLTVTQVLTYEPDRGGDLFNIAPRLLMNMADIPETELILPGSRIDYHLLLAGDSGDSAGITGFREWFENRGYENIRVQGIRDARPELKTALERAEQFLGLAVLVSIALAGLAVAMSAQRYALRHFDNCAIMRCLGAEQGLITRIYFIQLFILALVSAALGCALGYAAQGSLAALMAGLSKEALPQASLRPVFTGMATGLITILGFAMPQVMRLRRVPPLRVLRRDLEPLPLSGIATYGTALLALALLAPWQSGNSLLTAYTLAGIVVTLLLLALGARLLILALGRLRSRVGLSIRFGLANIARRSHLSMVQILGLGLGIMVMLLLTLVRTDLLDTWRDRLPDDAPNYFLINIQPEEVEKVRGFLKDRGRIDAQLQPMIRGRLTAINGNEVDPGSYGNDRARRLVAREFNLSWAKEMQADNRLEAGQWWSGNEVDRNLFSVEEGIGATLGIELGDSLTWQVAGREITGTVSNLRWVEWDSFHVNFFVVANPGTLEDYPATYISSFYIPDTHKELLIELVRNFPSITIIDVDAILTQVRSVMEQVVRAIEFVFIFTVLSGIVILIAAMQTTHRERIHESAQLSTLGASRGQILAGLIAEFVCLGLLTGILAAFAATVVEVLLAEYVFKMHIVINPLVWIIAPLASTLIITACGLLGMRSVLNTPPMTVLRRV
ncbi:MAG: FtsX-like permease family protein [Gammaproteobacteria bacterium]